MVTSFVHFVKDLVQAGLIVTFADMTFVMIVGKYSCRTRRKHLHLVVCLMRKLTTKLR